MPDDTNQTTDWQPIATAPKDGLPFVIKGIHGLAIMCWIASERRWKAGTIIGGWWEAESFVDSIGAKWMRPE